MIVHPSLLSADGEDSTVSIQIKLENEGSDEELETDMLYSPQLALKMALTEWLGEFCVPRQYNSKPNIILSNLHTDYLQRSYIWVVNGIEPTLTITRTTEDHNNKVQFFLSGNQATHGGVKGTANDVLSMPPPTLCSSTTVTTVFQQPIMSPAIPPLCLDQLPHPLAKAPQEEEVSCTIKCY